MNSQPGAVLTDSTEDTRKPEVDEVLRRIGRNLLVFQQIEHLLKHLLSSARYQGTLDSAQTGEGDRRAKFGKQTLGTLAGQFVGDVLVDPDHGSATVDAAEASFTLSFTIQADRSFVGQHVAEMKAVVVDIRPPAAPSARPTWRSHRRRIVHATLESGPLPRAWSAVDAVVQPDEEVPDHLGAFLGMEAVEGALPVQANRWPGHPDLGGLTATEDFGGLSEDLLHHRGVRRHGAPSIAVVRGTCQADVTYRWLLTACGSVLDAAEPQSAGQDSLTDWDGSGRAGAAPASRSNNGGLHHARHAHRPASAEWLSLLACAPTLDLAQGDMPVDHQALRVNPYISRTETRKLMAQSVMAVNQRIMAGDMLKVADAANAVGATARDIRQWVTEGRCVGVSTASKAMRLPRWQFDLDVWPWIQAIADALGTTDGWSLLSFLESPRGALNGRTPRQALEQGDPTQVIQLACWCD